MKHVVMLTALLGAVIAAGCGPSSGGQGETAPAFRPIEEEAALFWDRQTTETAELLRSLTEDYNAARPGGLLPVKVEHVGGYGDIFRKVSASIQARELPSMAVGYESMTAEYIQAGAVAELDPFLADPELGLSAEELADFFPAVLDTNRYAAHGNKMYSFPFCKSVLMMYYNKEVLAKAGIDAPPETWDAFLAQCRKVTAVTGKPAYALSVDCSTVDGWIFSMGGEVVRGRETLFDAPEALRVFELLETLATEKLAYSITPRTYDDEAALAQGEVAFTFRSSSGKTSVSLLMDGYNERWGMARIPQADPDDPHTVLFGPNICIFNTTPEQQRAAWAFTRHFTSAETTVKWALGTGYLPIRQSAADDPRMQAMWGEWEHNRAAYDCLAFAKPEPNLPGWQEVRGLVEKAETEILSGMKTARQAAAELKRQADDVLARSAG